MAYHVFLIQLYVADAVYIFQERDALRLLTLLEPEIYAKGGDYTMDTINQDERRLIELMGGRVAVLSGVAGKSTTALLAKIAQL